MSATAPNFVHVLDMAQRASIPILEDHYERASIPPLEHHCGSWIVVDRATGKAVLETFERRTAEAINQARYEVVTTAQWLCRLTAPYGGPQTPAEAAPCLPQRATLTIPPVTLTPAETGISCPSPRLACGG